jgi:hypothetical protein
MGKIKEKKRRIKKHFRRKMSQGHEKVGKSRNIVFSNNLGLRMVEK